MAAVSPLVKWAQRKECIILTIDTSPCTKDYTFEVNSASIVFSGTVPDCSKMYALNLQLYGAIARQYKKLVTDSKLQLCLTRKDAKYWPRLLATKEKVQFIKTDFERWVDEDSEDEDVDLCAINWDKENVSQGLETATMDRPKYASPESKDLFLINIKGTPTLSDSQGTPVVTCPMSNSEIKAYFKHKLDRNPRNTTLSMIIQTWKKVHEAMRAVEKKKSRNELAIDYLKKCFLTKEKMEWWITNCATSGAPDDFTNDNKHAVFLVEKECTRERIEEWLSTGSFKETVKYAYWDDPSCPIPQYDISKLPKKELIWMGKPWIPEFREPNKLLVSYDFKDKATARGTGPEEMDPYMLSYGNTTMYFD